MKAKVCKFCGGKLVASTMESCGARWPAWRCTVCRMVIPRVLTFSQEVDEMVLRHSAAVEAACGELAAEGMFEEEVEAVLIWLHPKRRVPAMERLCNLAYWLEVIYDRMRFADDHPISQAAADLVMFCRARGIDYDELYCC